ncbi:aminoacyl-tRNA hydrolase [Hydrogenobacter sp. T-2]|uniref:aminoacyl-tRNA hydrolase n=1 Tax=Pampinifervens diazotrophicum TaxID=1632018 RepID=UPI002B2637C0|nr:aminoacyl-tRNA hydrolase [Hydrogenobacter sp. T-2]WPM32931.1 aminoacyl-tRNA hydrolase [Hydrogenobacter sp. T-2]
MIRLIVGLGNPGKKYARTRHNVGFMVVDELLRRLKVQDYSEECLSHLYKARVDGKEVLIAKPQTYMNNSGLAVVNLLEEYDIKPEEMLVVYDDLDLPLGRLRLRLEGSSGGHHGIESIMRETKTDKFPRLKVGIGRPKDKGKVVDYVLSPFGEEEELVLAKVFNKASECLQRCVEYGLEESMNFCNAPML